MELDGIKLFVAAVEAGSFAEAARRRDVDPSSVSRAVAGLERALGARLLERSTRRLALTESGAAFYERAGPLIEALEAAAESARDLAGGLSGRLRVSASAAFGQAALGPLLPSFQARHPGLSVDLALSDAVVDLVGERIDVALRHGGRPMRDLVAAKLVSVRFHAVASPDYLARAGRPAHPEALSEHECLRFPFPGFREVWRFRAAGGEEVSAAVSGRLTVSSAAVLRDCAVRGMGVALLADWLIGADLAAGRLVDLFPAHRAYAHDPEAGVWAVYPSRAHLPAKTRAFIDFLRAELGGGSAA